MWQITGQRPLKGFIRSRLIGMFHPWDSELSAHTLSLTPSILSPQASALPCSRRPDQVGVAVEVLEEAVFPAGASEAEAAEAGSYEYLIFVNCNIANLTPIPQSLDLDNPVSNLINWNERIKILEVKDVF